MLASVMKRCDGVKSRRERALEMRSEMCEVRRRGRSQLRQAHWECRHECECEQWMDGKQTTLAFTHHESCFCRDGGACSGSLEGGSSSPRPWRMGYPVR